MNGYPNAEYKGFVTETEARAFVGMDLATDDDSTEIEKETDMTLQEGEAVAYVDGSYNVETGEYGCGVVFFYAGRQINLSRKEEDSEMAAMRNVAGEILGARIAMEEAVQRGARKLLIVHDYQGIASWCTGEWKANKEGTKAYKAYFDSLKDSLTIDFQKVKGHSGDVYNELADELAKRAIFENVSSPLRKNASES